MLGIDPMKFTIKLSIKYSFMKKSSWHEIQVDFVDDDGLEFICNVPYVVFAHGNKVDAADFLAMTNIILASDLNSF